MALLTNPSQELAPGNYLFSFQIPGMSTDLARKLSEVANVRATLISRFSPALADFELLGTVVRSSDNMFIAHVRVTGTPIIAIVSPIVQVILIIAAAYILIQFVGAVAVPVGANLGTAVAEIGGGLRDVGGGLKNVGSGLGSGLQYGLPILAVGASVLLVLVIFGALTMPRRGR